MLSLRQKEIIYFMKKNNEWITGKELSKIFRVSSRTIRKDILGINAFDANAILSHRRFGYKLNNSASMSKLDSRKLPIPGTPSDRITYLIKKLLFDTSGINLTELQSEIYVSRETILNDIQYINKLLINKNSSLYIVNIRGRLYIYGDEKQKRKLYKDLLTKELQDDFFNLDKINSLFERFNINLVKETLLNVLDENDYDIKQFLIPILLIHVGVAIERIYQGQYVKYSGDFTSLSTSKEFKVSKCFFNRLSKKMNLSIVDDEIKMFALLLLGKESKSYFKDEIVIGGEKFSITNLINIVLKDLIEIFDIDFSRDEDLKSGIKLHVYNMLERIKQHVTIQNTLLNEVKLNYPLIFKIAVQAGKSLSTQIHKDISENEIGFLAIHLGKSYEQYNQNKYKVLIILSLADDFQKTYMNKINYHFSEKMIVVPCIRNV